MNIPNREYWLAPQRREATAAYVGRHGKRFAVALALFLTYIHGLVVQANAHHPPVLSQPAVLGGLGVFLVAIALWGWALHARFGKRT